MRKERRKEKLERRDGKEDRTSRQLESLKKASNCGADVTVQSISMESLPEIMAHLNLHTENPSVYTTIQQKLQLRN